MPRITAKIGHRENTLYAYVCISSLRGDKCGEKKNMSE